MSETLRRIKQMLPHRPGFGPSDSSNRNPYERTDIRDYGLSVNPQRHI
jgi:hypothetical protein